MPLAKRQRHHSNNSLLLSGSATAAEKVYGFMSNQNSRWGYL